MDSNLSLLDLDVRRNKIIEIYGAMFLVRNLNKFFFGKTAEENIGKK